MGGNLKDKQRQFAVWLAVRFLNKLQHKRFKLRMMGKLMMGKMLRGRHKTLTRRIRHVRSWAEAYEELIIAKRRKATAN